MLRVGVLLSLLVAAPASAQTSLWTEASRSEAPLRADVTDYRVVEFDLDGMRAALAAQVTPQRSMMLRVPLPEGGALSVAVVEAPVFAPGLQARYPRIRTYIVQGAASGRLAMTPRGLSGLLYDAAGALVIDPLGPPDAVDAAFHAVYRASALEISEAVRASLMHDMVVVDTEELDGSERLDMPERLDMSEQRDASIGATLRTYRLAITTSGEYTQSRGGTVEGALAALAVSVSRVNVFFERDLAVRFELVEDNDQLIFLDPNTDPFSPANPDILLPIQVAIDDIIGDENYDVGHLITFDEGGGLAGLGVACLTGVKALAFSSVRLETTPFDLLVFPHELGHQLGALHAFVQPFEGFEPDPSGVEPGPGYTMMSYPHFAVYRPADERIGYHFHAASIDMMNAHVRFGGGGCGTDTPTGNDLPVVTAEEAIAVPPGAFVTLEGAASDASATALTYAWEQVDTYGDGIGAVPLVRALDPSPLSARTIPDLRRFLDRQPYRDETPLEPGVTYTFQVTVRDNVAGGGAQAAAQTRVSVGDSDTPFEITSVPSGTVYQTGDAVEVTWNVAGSDGNEIGAATVDVLVSTDNGETWTPVAAAVPNDGTETVTMPATPTDAGRLQVRATDRPFFTVAAEPFVLSNVVAADDDATPDAVTVSPVWPNPATDQARVQVRLDAPSTLRATVYDALGRTVAIADARDAAGTVTMPVEVGGLAAGVYLLRVEGGTFVETRRFVVAR